MNVAKYLKKKMYWKHMSKGSMKELRHLGSVTIVRKALQEKPALKSTYPDTKVLNRDIVKYVTNIFTTQHTGDI